MTCSVCIYSRRPVRLVNTIKSVIATANHPEQIEFVIRCDTDDSESLVASLDTEKLGNIQYMFGEAIGYGAYPVALWQMYQRCGGDWLWHFDDDATMEKSSLGWDDKLAEQPVNDNIVVLPEVDRLGGSRYFRNSIHPFMWLPNGWWKRLGIEKLDKIRHQPFDVFVFQTMVAKLHWRISYLDGVSTWHERSQIDPLNQLQRRF